MTRAEFVQQAVIAIIRAGSTQEWAIAEAVRLAKALGVSGEAPWSNEKTCTLANCGHMRQLDAIVDLLGMPRGGISVLDELRRRETARNVTADKAEEEEDHRRRAFSVSIYLQHNDSVLLVKHKRLDLWLPIGGERQGDETPLETAKRKVREETGWDPEVFAWVQRTGLQTGVPPGFVGYEEHTAGGRGLHLNFVFTGRVALGYLKEVPNSDGSWTQHVWADTSSSVPIPPNVAEAIHLILGTPRSQ